MDPLLVFFVEHWALSSAFLVLIVVFALNEWRHRAMGIPSLDPQQLVNLLNHNGGVAVDIRSQLNYQQGHIIGAHSLPQEEFATKLNALNKYKSKPVILVCMKGLEAPKMAKLLAANGFTQLYFLANGMEGWVSNGMPVVKS
ncbi:MAG: rhodanese-like domain-containing protein [Candidatus Berkiella sp.]